MDLPEVARAVAEALGLRDFSDHLLAPGWHSDPADHPPLWKDGSNLSHPYWFKACCEWLEAQGYEFGFGQLGEGHYAARLLEWDTEVDCPLAEAPARLVAKVWRRQHADLPR